MMVDTLLCPKPPPPFPLGDGGIANTLFCWKERNLLELLPEQSELGLLLP